MKLQTIALSVALALAAAPVLAQDKSKDSMAKAPTAQECKDWMTKNKDAKKDDPMKMKCDDMMKKDGGAMKSGDAMAPKK